MIRMAQYGTRHGHAVGKLLAMQRNPAVELVGIFEPNAERCAELKTAGGSFAGVHFFDRPEDLLEDHSIVAVASEGGNDESLGQTEAIVCSGKHVWYDKPAGEDWDHWQRVVAQARDSDVLIQMGYMLRYSPAFIQVAQWARDGFLGDVFSIRAHMPTHVPDGSRPRIAIHQGGIFFDLAGHVLDQVLWILGRPQKVTSFLRNETGEVSEFTDNGLAVFEFDRAMACIGISAMEARPTARRFEVFGRQGSAIITEPFEPGKRIRLCLEEARDGYETGEQIVDTPGSDRQHLYELELEAFLSAIRGDRHPDRSLDHELLVQEWLLRSTGVISG